MSERAEFVCPACRCAVGAPPSLAGAAAPCPKCGAHVSHWPAPISAAPVPIPPPPPIAPPSSLPESALPPGVGWLALVFCLVCVALASVWAVYAHQKAQEERAGRDRRDSRESYEPERKTAKSEIETEWQIRVVASVGGSVGVVLAAFATFFCTSRRSDPAGVAVAWGAALGGVAGSVGALMSQFAPVFGGPIEKYLARPLSPVRLSEMPVHTLAFGLVGLVIGAGLGALQARAPKSP